MAKAEPKSSSEHTVGIWVTVLVTAVVCSMTMPISGGLQWFHLLITIPSWIFGLMLYRRGPRRNSLGSILALIGIALLTIVLALNLANILWFGHGAILK
ncbi:MAG: hypothetical protein H7A51_13500 [Akkermansiaceae bacterium]|nr:hypothetical protein [Akkermansiaceae bacterium]